VERRRDRVADALGGLGPHLQLGVTVSAVEESVSRPACA
jgi:hypothetical protein